MDELIPGNSTMPKASEIGMPYILDILKDMADIAGLFRYALETIQSYSINHFEKSFQDITKNERITILKNLETKEEDIFGALRSFTNESYYLNETVHALLGYELNPTGTLGPKMEPFNESLLDRVKAKTSFYTKI
jgi:hypothetical protein